MIKKCVLACSIAYKRPNTFRLSTRKQFSSSSSSFDNQQIFHGGFFSLLAIVSLRIFVLSIDMGVRAQLWA